VPSRGSLWRDRGADLFRDPRARRVGDILTVTIAMKEKASFDNSSKRSRDSSHGFGLDMSHAIDWKGFASAATATMESTARSNTAQDGKGAIARSENIDLRIAAVVTDVLPNGNLLIQGSQELRVNYELRVLTFTGIVNIADIKADNTISHERIAEARMSYGGRGRIMEVQQPAWGHQIVDLLFPF
jgi:flagellar L-ring protein precursor FlgH